MATPTKTPAVQDLSTTSVPSAPTETPIVTLPDSAVIRPVPPVRTPAPATPTRGLWIAIIGLAVLLLGTVGVIVWQQSRVDDASSAAIATGTDLRISMIQVERAQAEVARLETQLAQAETETRGLERQVERLRAQLIVSETQGEQTQTELTQTQTELTQTQTELTQTQTELTQTQTELATAQANEADARAAYQEARAELYDLAGAPLADGVWNGRLYMVGGTQIPPMLAYDEMKLFRGDAAIEAMIADGVPKEKAKRCGQDCVYWQNPSDGWRIMTIAPDTTVTLRSFAAGGPGPTTMGLEKFTRIFNGTAPQNAHFATAPYRMTMSGGEVTGIEELLVSW